MLDPQGKIKSMAQGCENLPPVAGLERSLHTGPGPGQAPSFHLAI